MSAELPCRIVGLEDAPDGVLASAHALFKTCGIRPDSNEELFEACVLPTGEVVGVSVLGLYDSTPDDMDPHQRPRWTFSVVVADRHRRKGIARALVRSIMAAYPREDVLLEGKVVNPYMADLLRSLGFHFYDQEHEDAEWDDHQRSWGRRMYLPNPPCWEHLPEREKVRLKTLEAREDAAIRRRRFPVTARLGADGQRVRVLGLASDLTGRVDPSSKSGRLVVARTIEGEDAGETVVVPTSSVYDDGRPWRRPLPPRCPGREPWSVKRRNADDEVRKLERRVFSGAGDDEDRKRLCLWWERIRSGKGPQPEPIYDPNLALGGWRQILLFQARADLKDQWQRNQGQPLESADFSERVWRDLEENAPAFEQILRVTFLEPPRYVAYADLTGEEWWSYYVEVEGSLPEDDE